VAKPPAKTPLRGVDVPPEDFAQVPPRNLHDTSDIRFVMVEMGKLTERLDGLVAAVDKLPPAIEKSAEKHTADMKERFVEVKADLKESREKIQGLANDISAFKGGLKTAHLFYALALVAFGAFLTWYLRSPPQAPAPQASTGIVETGTTQGAAEAAPVVDAVPGETVKPKPRG
jgi:hypothetical protein